MASNSTKKVSRKKPVTPTSTIRNGVRRIWMMSREQHQARKDQNNTCQKCGRKGSVSKDHPCKTNMHHVRRPNWARVDAAIREEVLQTPADYVCLCVECHRKEHEKDHEDC